MATTPGWPSDKAPTRLVSRRTLVRVSFDWISFLFQGCGSLTSLATLSQPLITKTLKWLARLAALMHNHSGGSLRSRRVDGTSRERRGLLFTRTAATTVAHPSQLIIVLLNRPRRVGGLHGVSWCLTSTETS